jgi:hypothetical protein
MENTHDCLWTVPQFVTFGHAWREGRCGRWAVGLCLLLGVLSGCGPRGPAVEMVEGVVLLDGEPVEGATIFFSPLQADGKGSAGLPAVGQTGNGGAFRLSAVGGAGKGARPGAGTKVGEYVVTVVKQESDPAAAANPNPDAPPAPPGEFKIRDLLPVIYKLGATSPLRATVKQGKNSYRFELDSTAVAGSSK